MQKIGKDFRKLHQYPGLYLTSKASFKIQMTTPSPTDHSYLVYGRF